MTKRTFTLLILVLLLSLIAPLAVSGRSQTVQATLLHTNDFHGRLETDYKGRGGACYLAGKVNDIREEVGEENVLLLDAGDEYFAAPAISQLLLGESTVDIFNRMGYDLAVFGNHEFDKGEEVLIERVAQAEYPWLGANVVLEDTEWGLPDWAQAYEILTVGKGRNQAKIGVIGLAGEETPEVTLIGTTEGLVFKDLTETVLHYYDEVAAQSDAVILVVHMGTNDSGPFDGLQTVAQNLIDAGKPVPLMIGGHQHQALYEPVWVGDTAIVSAGYYGRYLGQVEVSINRNTNTLKVKNYQLNTIMADLTLEDLIASLDSYYEEGEIKYGIYKSLSIKLQGVQNALDKGKDKNAEKRLDSFINQVEAQSGKGITEDAADALISAAQRVFVSCDPEIADRVDYWAEIVAPEVDQPVGETNINLVRDYNDESNMGDIVTDSMLWKADSYDDGELNGSVDIAFTNPGGLRADIIIPDGAALPYTVTWGMTFDVLPFGNTLYLMDLTGAQIEVLLNQSANLYKGILQTSGATWSWYNDCRCDEPTAWGAFDVEVGGVPLDSSQVYRVVTNNFLAGGQDGWTTFGEGTNRWDTYYDLQQGFVEYIRILEVIDAEDIPMGRITYIP